MSARSQQGEDRVQILSGSFLIVSLGKGLSLYLMCSDQRMHG